MFTINQVRHLYVAKTLSKDTAAIESASAGAILPKADNGKTTLWFQYMSPAGLVSSDKIDIKNILYAKATASEKMAHELVSKKLTLDADVDAAPVAGQEYIVRLAFRNYIGLGDEDNAIKFGSVLATSGMNASTLYKKLALSFVKNIAKEPTPLVNVYLATAEANVAVTAATKESALTGTYTGIVFEEAVQAWSLGKMPQTFIPFEVQTAAIEVEGIEVIWGKVEKVTSANKVENGKNIADLEYFLHGFRGDEYRGMGYPNNIETTYLVDPSKKYDTLDIHYAYVGSNESVQKSEKDITIVCENDGSHTAMKALISAINTATGLTIANPA
jgi:hypothetical protein